MVARSSGRAGRVMVARLTLIAAVARNGVIGCENRLPWHLPEDLRFFKATTLGHPMIMGRKTRESLGENPLPGRPHIVLSRDPQYAARGSHTVPDFPAALAACEGADEVFVIGGAQVYALALPYARRVLLTCVPGEYAGDAFFPDISGYPDIEVIRRAPGE